MMKVVLMCAPDVRHTLGSLMCAPSGHVRYYMMKVVLMCAPSGQCQVLHDEGSLNCS